MERKYLEDVLCNIKRMSQPTEAALQTAGAIVALLGTDIPEEGSASAGPVNPTVIGTEYERASEELRAAEKYIKEGNLEFARDELRHGAMWIEQAQRKAVTDAEKKNARDLIAWHRLLQQEL